jgi:hypothetical protein
MREDTYAIPHQQRHLTALIMRKLLASSSYAIAGTLETMKSRLENLRDGLPVEKKSLVELVIAGEEIEDEYLDEIQIGVEQQNRVDGQDNAANGAAPPYSSSGEQATPPAVDRAKLEAEITELTQYIRWARSIGIDAKTRTLLHALEIGYSEMAKMGANRKALIFTESRRTQQYVRDFLEANGYTGKIVLFNGTNSDAESRRIYDRWVEANAGTGRVTGSRPVDIRTALIEEFRDHAQIMIATEAAAEGVNLQFCSLVVNYDLPWNPQRIEQRIGRCHRYGQKHDVVVINFLNERNEADRRVMELLEEKFRLFNGVFGASDDVLGTIESGVDFEKRILEIYQQCRSPEQIEAAFAQLQQEMEQSIKARLEATRELLLEHFDEDVHDRLRGQLDTTRQRLDRVGQRFWQLTRFILDGQAAFDDESLCFDLWQPLPETIKPGRYHLISKTQPNVAGEFLYRLSHPLGEQVLQRGRKCSTPPAEVTFDITGHPTRISPVEALKGRYGWLTLQRLQIESFGLEEYLLFSAFDDAGRPIDAETCERLFACRAAVAPLDQVPAQAASQLEQEASRHAAATLSHSLEANNRFFQEERERLEKWADDMVAAAEKELADTKGQIKALNRQARVATSTNEQHELQSKVRDLERKQRQQRRRIFDVEDEISHKRDRLVELLEKRMAQKTQVESLFTIRWSVV